MGLLQSIQYYVTRMCPVAMPAAMTRISLVLWLGLTASMCGSETPPIVPADELHQQRLRAVWEAASFDQRRNAGVEVAVEPPPGVRGQPVRARLASWAEQIDHGAAPYAAGLRAENWVGSRVPVVSQQHWVEADQLPPAYDARLAYPRCSTMRAIQNQGACAGCYSFATVASLGDRICQATNSSVDVILSAEDPLFCPNLGGCRGGNLGPVWDYLANVGVPSGCSPGQNLQPSGFDGSNTGTQPQSAMSWSHQAATTPGGCCYPVAWRTMESNNPTCLQEPCPGGSCPLKRAGGDPGLGQCVDFWGNVTTNTTLLWRHYRARPNSSHGFANDTELMRAIISDGPVPTAIWLCAGDNKPFNKSSPVYASGLAGYKGGVYDCPHYGCGFAF
eukprot:COSAG02_NODE_3047_length_7477_cov_15.840201_10_plen_388_part_01